MTRTPDDASTSGVELLRAQSDVLEQVIAGGPLDSTLNALVSAIEAASPSGVIGSVLLLDEDGVHLRHGAAPSLPDFYNEAIDGVAIGPAVGSCGTAAYRRAQVIVEDIATDPLWEDFRDVADRASLRACWSTPIFAADDRLLGTFAMYYREPRRPSEDELALIDVLVRTTALAIERRRDEDVRDAALRREREAREDLNFILDVTTQIASTLDYAATLEQLAELAVPKLADICVIDVAEDGAIRRAAVAGAAPGLLDAFAPTLGGTHPAARVLATGVAEYETRVSDDTVRRLARNSEHLRVLRALALESYMCLPLAARGGVFGTLTLVSAGSGRRFDEADLGLARDLATRVALVIDNTRLYEATRTAEQRMALVGRAGLLLTSSLQLDDVLARLCGLLVPEVGDVCEVHARQVDGTLRRRRIGPAGLSPASQPASMPAGAVKADAAGRAQSFGRLDPADVATLVDPATAPGGLAAAIAVPLTTHAEGVGVVVVGRRPGSSAPIDAELLDVLAGRAAMAVENARRFEAERSAAELLQRALLPRELPRIEGVEIAVRYEPGIQGTAIGGDWYDVLPFPDGRVGVVIGDVMGRGIPAATVMGQVRNALRGLALQRLDPSDALRYLDQILQADRGSPMATVFYGVLDLAGQTLTYANAGHCPPLLLAGNEPPRWVDAEPDPPLAAWPGTSYRQTALELPPGATLVFYTDGLVERRGEDLSVGFAALADAACDTAGGPTTAEELCDHLLTALENHGDADDTAVMTVRLTPTGPPHGP